MVSVRIITSVILIINIIFYINIVYSGMIVYGNVRVIQTFTFMCIYYELCTKQTIAAMQPTH